MQRELNTIQKQNKLNRVFAIDEVGNDGVNYRKCAKSPLL